jgi:hypothetical protein
MDRAERLRRNRDAKRRARIKKLREQSRIDAAQTIAEGIDQTMFMQAMMESTSTLPDADEDKVQP